MTKFDAEYHRNYYHTKRDVKKLSAQKTERKRKIRGMVWSYLLEHPCVDCGESDPVVLEFDHIRDKTINISDAMLRGWAFDRILTEIAKCEVRCANCHRRKTHKQFNYTQGIV